MSDETLISPIFEEPILEFERIRFTDLDLRNAASVLAKKEEKSQRKLYETSKKSAIKSAKRRIAILEKQVEELGESKAELLGYVGEIANLQSWLKRIQDEKEEVSNERDFILLSLLNQKDQVKEEEVEIPEAKPITTSMVIENIWFVRSLIASAILLGAGALLAYSVYFREIFDSTGSVVSYFPWSWQTAFTSSSGVTALYNLGVGVSLLLMGICLVGVVYFVPELIRSLIKQSLSEFPESPKGAAVTVTAQ